MSDRVIDKGKVLYAFEIAYWRYIADRYRRTGIASSQVILSDILPLINQILKELNRVELSLEEVFRILREWEDHFLYNKGRIWFRLGTRILTEDGFIPVQIYEPYHYKWSDLKRMGVPVDQLYTSTIVL